jgi:uncharacterized protein
MKVFAVTTEGEGLAAGLNLKIAKGSGKAWVDVEPLVGTSTQSTARIAVVTAAAYSDRTSEYDYFFDIDSTASVVEGPSAGAAMALLLISQLTDRKLPQNVSITGTITDEGYIGPVGGVYEKALAASRHGIKLFLIPKGEAKQTIRSDKKIKSVNLTEYAKEEMGLTVVEVSTIDDVIGYAFADIEKIDINTSSQVLPDFIPPQIDYPEYLESMKKLTVKYLEDAKSEQEEAKNAVSTTLISDSSVLSSLLEVLNTNEDSLKTADILAEQNYFYSAANYAFVSKVNAMFVRDISNNPGLIEPQSTAFDLRLLSLKRDIDNMKEVISDTVFIESIEWQAAALQRLAWAEQYSRSLTEARNEIVVVTYGDNAVINGNTIDDLLKYEFAVAWVAASRDFYEIAKSSGSEADIRISNLTVLEPAVDDYTARIEEILRANVLEEDITRRLDAAVYSLQEQSYLAAVYDAASAYALAEAASMTEGESFSGLEGLLQEKISKAELAVGQEGSGRMWSKLYLDHAKYFREAALFYQENAMMPKYREALESGIGLAVLAAEMAEATDTIRNSVSAEIERTGVIPAKPAQEGIFSIQDPFALVVALLSFTLLLMLALIIVVMRRNSHYNLKKEISSLRKLEDELSEKHRKGIIPDEDFDTTVSHISDEIERLDSMRTEKAEHLLNVGKLKYAMYSVERQLDTLKHLYSGGLLTENEFRKSVLSLRNQLFAIHSAIKNETNKLGEEEKAIKKTVGRIRKEKKGAAKAKGKPPAGKKKKAGKAAAKAAG